MNDSSRDDGRVPEPPYRTDAYAEYSDSIEIASLRQQLAQERERAEKHLKDLSDHASEIAEARDMLRAKLAAAKARAALAKARGDGELSKTALSGAGTGHEDAAKV